MTRLDLPFLASTIFGAPHMIRQGKMAAILDVIMPRLAGGVKLPVAAFDDDGADFSAEREFYTVDRGVAVIPVMGTLVRRGSWLDAASGLTSYHGLKECVREAMRDPDVRAVLFDIDSHGGEAGGVFDLVDYIRAMSKKYGKPVWAHANENAASAAYMIACGGDQIWLSQTAEVGSIGIVCAHLDQSEADKKAGLKWTFIFEGDHKIHGNPHMPLDDVALETAQADSRILYDMFVDRVSKHRQMTAQAIRDTKADTYRGQLAVDAGLADRVGTFDQALSALARSVDKTSTVGGGGSSMQTRRSSCRVVASSQAASRSGTSPKSLKTKTCRKPTTTKTATRPRTKKTN